MKRLFVTISLTAFMTAITPAMANNTHIEAAIKGYGDLSMFYQALVNTGVISELQQDQRYTIFAPTNQAFAEMPQQKYPCLYEVQCRPQIAAMLRNHIVVSNYDLKELTRYGQGIRTVGSQAVHVTEPYVGQYAVNGNTILSKEEIDGNFIYRIAGVIAWPQELVQFQTVNYSPESREVIHKTIRTYEEPGSAYPAGTMVASPPPGVPGDMNERTTIIHTYTTEQ